MWHFDGKRLVDNDGDPYYADLTLSGPAKKRHSRIPFPNAADPYTFEDFLSDIACKCAFSVPSGTSKSVKIWIEELVNEEDLADYWDDGVDGDDCKTRT